MTTENISIYDNIPKTEQIVYDSFNTLMFSTNPVIFHKLAIKIAIYDSVKHLFGDILEFGVFKGASLALWLQLKKLYEPNSLTQIIGFDFYDANDTIASLNNDTNNVILMTETLNRVDTNDLDINIIKTKCDAIIKNSTILIKGDASNTSKKFNELNQGARIKILYLDMDTAEPTYNVMNNLWNKLVVGGKIILDEYGHHKWDESNGADKFLKTLETTCYCVTNTNILAPTLIITKLK